MLILTTFSDIDSGIKVKERVRITITVVFQGHT